MTLRRLVSFWVLSAFTIALFCAPLQAVFDLSLHDQRYVQVLAAPFLCLFLLFWERDRVFSDSASSPRYGLLLLLPLLLAPIVFLGPPPLHSRIGLCIAILAATLSWMVVFILCYGFRSFRSALFPFCCLFLMIPPPPEVMDKITIFLQNGSAAVSHEMLLMAGIPVFAQGTTFSLPGLIIEVAPECSGIHSTLALLLTAVLMGRIYLRCGLSRFLLVAMVIPIAIIKNAFRITVIAALSLYVNRAFLFGSLHRNSGLVFTPLAVLVGAGALYALRLLEAKRIWRPLNEANIKRVGSVLRTSSEL